MTFFMPHFCSMIRLSSASLFPTYIISTLQIAGQSCPLSFKGSPYWLAPEVRHIFLFGFEVYFNFMLVHHIGERHGFFFIFLQL